MRSASLPDVDVPCAQLLEAGHLGGLVIRAQIEVQAVLHGLVLGHLNEQDLAEPGVGALQWLDHVFALVPVLLGDPPAERF